LNWLIFFFEIAAEVLHDPWMRVAENARVTIQRALSKSLQQTKTKIISNVSKTIPAVGSTQNAISTQRTNSSTSDVQIDLQELIQNTPYHDDISRNRGATALIHEDDLLDTEELIPPPPPPPPPLLPHMNSPQTPGSPGDLAEV